MSRPLVSSLLASILLAACGDGATYEPVDAAVDTDADPLAPDAAGQAQRAVAVSGDFNATGVFSTLALADLSVDVDVASGVASQDPVLRRFGNELYVVNRFGVDNVTILDVDGLTLEAQLSTGADSNPQDVAVVGDKLYVAALGTAGVVVIDRGNGNALATIDLGVLDEDDGLPNCMSVYAVGDEVFVACGILDDADPFLAPRGPGKIAVIDTSDDSVARTMVLPAANPVGWLQPSDPATELGGDLLLGLVPSYSDFSGGCLARVPVAAGGAPAASCAVSNADMGGYANRYEATRGGIVWIAVNGFDENFASFGALRGFDASTLTMWDGQVSAAGQNVKDLAVCGDGDVVVADRPDSGASGLRVYDGATTLERTTAPLEIGLPPSYGNGLTCYSID